jgi:conjugative transfer pilus assembly protein TraH
MLKKRFILPFIFISLSTNVCANVQNDMQKFFHEIGTSTNVTPAGAYKGQEGGFYTGGSLYSRNPTREYQLMNVQVPSISAGCGGIDVFTGGMGFIDSKRLVEMMKAIGANSMGYTFSLALKQMSPQIMNQIEELQSWANEANWNNINSCQAATKIVNSAAGYFQETSKQNCINKGLSDRGDDYGNYINARQKCQDQKEVNAKNREAADDPTFRDSVITNVNIVWRAINNNPMLASLDKELKYMLMSLTGTMIISTDGPNGAPKKQVYLSKVLSDDLINHLAAGQKFKVYACKDDDLAKSGCLNIVEKEIEIGHDKSFVGQVRAILQSMEQKVMTDTPLNEKEKAFLESTTLPIYRMLNIHAAASKGTSLMMVTDYAEIIAMDILYRYLDRSIDEVLQSHSNNLLPKDMEAEFYRMITIARERVRDIRQRQAEKMSTTNDMVARVQMMEKQISATVSTNLYNSMNWGKGLR